MAIWGRSRRAGGSSASPEVEVGFGAAAYERMARHVDAALAKARARGVPVIASVTVPVAAGIDPLAHVAVARRADEPWSSFAQPARGDYSLATFGCASRVTAAGADRFDSLAAACGQVVEAAEADDLFHDPKAPPGSGVIWSGGFSFYDEDPWSDTWRGTPSAEFLLPRAAICRVSRDDPQARLTLSVSVEPDSVASELMGEIEGLVDRLALDVDFGAPADDVRPGAADVTSSNAPAHYEQAVARATAMIEAGELEKIVLAREVVLRRDSAIDPFRALRMLGERFPDCTTFAVGRGSATFLGASPELLIRREGRRASTMALAGSMRRGGDPETDRHLGQQLLDSEKDNEEHAIVVRRIERTLGRLSAWVATGEKPELIKVKNIQHLATPIRAQLTEPRPVIELAGLLHPTPAVGGEPWPEVAEQIKALEGFDRGWYTGGVGWMDLLEDGEFHVALRSALLDGAQARLFAGAGIVGESDPAAELAETETKLQALLPVLSES